MKKPWASVSGSMSGTDYHDTRSPVRSKSDANPNRDRISGPFPLLQNGSVDSAALNDSINEAHAADTTMSTDVPDDVPNETPAPTIETLPSSTDSPNALHRRIHVAQDASVAGNSVATDTSTANVSQPGHRRNAPSRNVRISTFSADTSGGGKEKPSGRRSTLRGALGKLFGRKKKTSIGQSSLSGPDSVRETPETTEHQNNVPAEATEDQGQQNAHKRSISLPQDEHERALRTYTMGAEVDRVAGGSRNSVHTRSNFSRRQPGTHSVLRPPGVLSEFSGLSPRPASIHGKVDRQEPQSETEEEIGKAITTKDFTAPREKRRSRSLSALMGAAGKDFDGGDRRLSGEIRYWRESRDLDVKSHISSHAETEESHFALPEEEPMPNFAPKSPLQPFAFPEGSSWKELSGMKITLAASLESRIDHLEARLHNLEGAAGRQPRKLAVRKQGQPEAKHRKPHYRPKTQGSISSISSSDMDTSYPFTVPAVRSSHRPMSKVAIRGAASLPTLSKDASAPLTVDHYTTLMALLETERSSREALEAQVKALGHQLRILTKAAEQSKAPSGLGLSNQPAMSAFDFDEEEDDDDEAIMMKRRSRNQQVSKSSQLRPTMAGTDASTTNSPLQDDEEYLASFATPPEEFTDDEDGKRRAKSARTMSLSQMTMKKPLSPVAQEPLPKSPL